MSRPQKPYKSYEDLIYKYLIYNGLTISKNVDGHFYRKTQKEFATELGEKITLAQMEYNFTPKEKNQWNNYQYKIN